MSAGNKIIGLARPLFELKGPLSKIDLSAWLSGISYFMGVMTIGVRQFILALSQSRLSLFIVLAALVLFFAATIFLQKFIGIRLLANEYGKPARLVTDGPFAYSRNPIYVAFLVPLVSLAIVSPIASGLATLFYIVSMNYTVLRIEERDLLAKFGDAFTAYTNEVRRWI